MQHRLIRMPGAVLRAAHAIITELLDALRELWQAHRELLVDNPAYAAAVMSGVAAILAQSHPIDLLAAITATLLAIYAATRGGLTPA